jgi:asparagine synthase (glutamine-hydrolysing)
MAAQPGIAEACDPGAVTSLFNGLGDGNDKRLGQAAWTLLYFALWHRRHILGAEPQGGVFDTLAQSA